MKALRDACRRSSHRLEWWAIRFVSLFARYPVSIAYPFLGEKIRFEVRNSLEYTKILSSDGEKRSLDFLAGSLGSGDVFFDLGAGKGLYAASLGKKIRGLKIFAFEPNPAERGRLEAHLAVNGVLGATVVEWAVSDSEEDRELDLFFDDVSAGAFRPHGYENRRYDRQARVLSRSLDSALRRGLLPVPDAMKIDIEGAEVLCLRGSAALFDGVFGKRPRTVCLELHYRTLSAYGASPADVLSFFAEKGYRIADDYPRGTEWQYIFVDAKT
ncbi:MAG TPA: FkbM family methyltransferase [Candidatus Eisenbacteria bacterium]|nr:FkbM family methyltransferase [Candidatus Eisenbacteria bacterium]